MEEPRCWKRGKVGRSEMELEREKEGRSLRDEGSASE